MSDLYKTFDAVEVRPLSFSYFPRNRNDPVQLWRQIKSTKLRWHSWTHKAVTEGEAEQNLIEVSADVPQNESNLSSCQCCALCKCHMWVCPQDVWGKTRARRHSKAQTSRSILKSSSLPPTSRAVFKTEAKSQRMKEREDEVQETFYLTWDVTSRWKGDRTKH